jgi:Mg-chelatase subunit ChlD
MKRFKDKRKVVSLTLVGVAYLLIVIPLVISNLEKQQSLKGRAQTANTTIDAQTCGIANSNTMMIIDRSGSMGEVDASGATKISNAIIAGNNFVDLTAKNLQNELGLVSFSTTATTDSPLTNNFSSVKTQINALKATGSTCIQCAIDAANQALSSGKRTNTKNVIVLLTDGIANYVEGGTAQVSQTVAEQAALTAATNSHTNNGTIIFAIGLGKDVNAPFLQQLATSTGGQYYFPPSSQNLNDIYTQISQIIAQGSISGFVFNDTNGNGKFDTGEQKLSGWTVQLAQQGQTTQSFTTDSTGSFMIPQLCNGTYTLTEVPQNGWNETVPVNPSSYTINITTGNAFTDINFGNVVAPPTPTPTPKPTATPTSVPPTVTPTPGKTTLNMTAFLDGIGNRGDNTNPTASSFSNKNPQHPTINVDVQIFTSNNSLIAEGPGTLTYNAALGNYTGDVPITTGFPSGIYLFKVKADRHLRKLIDGIITVTSGKDNVVPVVAQVAGDINNDNVLDILDYNLLLNCYSDLAAAVACPSMTAKSDADLNDDGSVNQIDYNLFLRELSTQPGQ